MEKEIIIAVNEESAEIFKEFAEQYPEYMMYIEHKALIGVKEVVEFLVQVTPSLIAALLQYLIAKQAKGDIRIKKGDIEIELKNVDITPEQVIKLLEKLEQKENK